MISLSRILVGVDLSHGDRLISEDLSAHCENAVERALLLAQGGGGHLTFMAVIDISEQALHLIEMRESINISPIEEDAHKVLQKLVDRAQAAGVSASYQLKFGKVSVEIIKEILRANHSLLVIGGKEKRTLDHFVFGRSTTKLMRKCPVPVLVAKFNPQRPVESILVADDLTELGETLLDAGVQAARIANARLHVVHILENDRDAKLVASGIPPELIKDVHEKEADAARAEVATRLSRTDHRTLIHGTMTHVESGTPETIILRLLEEHEIDLLVMGTVGRSGITAMMLGNTAERLFYSAPCSLLVVKPAGFQSPIKLD